MLISYTHLILLLNLILKKDCKKKSKVGKQTKCTCTQVLFTENFLLSTVHCTLKNCSLKYSCLDLETNRLSSFSINLDQFLVQRDRQGEATLVVTRLPEVGGPAMERRLFREVEANISKVQLVILARTKD